MEFAKEAQVERTRVVATHVLTRASSLRAVFTKEKSLFFFNDTATTEIYTLSLHDALPIWAPAAPPCGPGCARSCRDRAGGRACPPRPRASPVRRAAGDRESTRLNSSHANISYAVFCLKKNRPQPWSLPKKHK